jgi:2-polyprenyl-3-methyl-5-hydroxy-6-metoxy-1,4-benzoquinol methylase
MNPNKALWEKGNFTKIAAFMREFGEEVVKSIRITPPLRAPDLSYGGGATAMPLALLGTEVTGIDIAGKPRGSREQTSRGGRRQVSSAGGNLPS